MFPLAVPSSEIFRFLKVSKSIFELYRVLWLARYIFSENNRNTQWVFFSDLANEGTPGNRLLNPQNQKREIVTLPIRSDPPVGQEGVAVKDVTPSSQLVEALTPRPCSPNTLQLS